MYRTVHRPSGRATVGGLVLALGVLGAATVPTASGSTPSAAGEPKVIEVSTDTPLGTATPHHPGAPVNPGPYSVEQPDGSRISITAWGDSRTSGYQTRGGYAVTKDASGVWRYAVRLDAAGRPVASDLQVGKATPPAAARGLRTKVVERASTARAAAEARAPRRAAGTGNGPQPGLVILVSFANQASVGSTEDQWSQDFFGAGSSVSGYYQANSFGKFALVPAAESAGAANNGVVGWLQLPTTTRTSATTTTPPRPSSASTPSRPPIRTSTTRPSTPTRTARSASPSCMSR